MNVIPASATPFPWLELAYALAIVVGILFIALLIQARRLNRLHERLEAETFQRQSLSSTYGRITEQWLNVPKLPLTEEEVLGF
jgi:hypothetical protein